MDLWAVVLLAKVREKPLQAKFSLAFLSLHVRFPKSNGNSSYCKYSGLQRKLNFQSGGIPEIVKDLSETVRLDRPEVACLTLRIVITYWDYQRHNDRAFTTPVPFKVSKGGGHAGSFDDSR